MEVGQKVFVKKINDAARYINPYNLISEKVIEKIGKKYFYLKDWQGCKFDIEQKRDISNYCSRFQVYLSMQEISDENEYNDKLSKIRKCFDYMSNPELSLSELREIHKIIFKE
jgi:hypothetical protein